MDEVWSGLDLQLQASDIAGLHRAAATDDPFWPALADCAASFLAGDDSSCFGTAHLTGSANEMDVDLDTSGFLPAEDGHHLMLQEPMYSSSSLSSVSIDSGGSSSPFLFALDDAAASPMTKTTGDIFSRPAAAQDPFDGGDDAAIMRAMMAVLSSASPSSSESWSPPQSLKGATMQAAAEQAVQRRGGSGYGHGHVTVKSTSIAVGPERTSSLTSSGGRKQQEDGRAAPGSNNNSQVYHRMSERKRREKLNDSFQTLKSLLPPCSKKDKTTVLINAASFLKTLEAQVSELEVKNAKLERHIPRQDGGGCGATTAAHRKAKVQISRAASDGVDQVNLTVMVMVECDIEDLVLHVLERLRWMEGVAVLSVDADTYSPQMLLKAIASIKLHITDGDCWNETSFHEAMTTAVHDATSPSSSCASASVGAAAASALGFFGLEAKQRGPVQLSPCAPASASQALLNFEAVA